MENNTTAMIFSVLCCGVAPPLIFIIGIIAFFVKKPDLLRGESGKRNIIAFVVGAVLWAISFALMAQGYGAGYGGIRAMGITAGLILSIILWIMSCIGWDTFPVGGGGGFQLKMIATVVIGGTIVGLIFVFYWTGKCALRAYERMRQEVI
jgi:hypothetical protein